MQKLEAENELHEYRYAPDQAVRASPVRKRELTKPPSGGAQGQLRLSLTNTYHEWPVIVALPEDAFKSRLNRVPHTVQEITACNVILS
jgi:hypothetical protein